MLGDDSDDAGIDRDSQADLFYSFKNLKASTFQNSAKKAFKIAKTAKTRFQKPKSVYFWSQKSKKGLEHQIMTITEGSALIGCCKSTNAYCCAAVVV